MGPLCRFIVGIDIGSSPSSTSEGSWYSSYKINYKWQTIFGLKWSLLSFQIALSRVKILIALENKISFGKAVDYSTTSMWNYSSTSNIVNYFSTHLTISILFGL